MNSSSDDRPDAWVTGGQYQPLTNDNIHQIHTAALDILESTGVAVYSEKAQDILEAAGAKVDRSIPRAWLSKSMVEDAIASAPSKVELYGRTPDNHLTLEDKRVYMGTGGTTINVLDLNGTYRKSSLLDCHQIPRLVDALENIHFIVLPVYPNELTEENADVNRFYGGLSNSSKHIMGGMFSLEGTL
ncbi:MAG: trimethylamine methyltransferase family protein, partial [Anaerolineales bacterium]